MDSLQPDDFPFPPTHPVPTMQAAFNESILDQASTALPTSSPTNARFPGARPKQQYHHLQKLAAQLAFGIHLLHARLAKSDSEVVRILQSHVNGVDEFLSKTTQDFKLTREDIQHRLRHLRVPLATEEASRVFDVMLQDREFREQILKGNENVEYVITRTTRAMNRAIKDIEEGLGAVDELAKYMLGLKNGWKNAGLLRVYAAMTHNVEGWFRCLVGLQMKSGQLTDSLAQLNAVMMEIERRVGIASRKDRGTHQGKASPSRIHDKPLPPPPRSPPILRAIDVRADPVRTLSKRSRSQPLTSKQRSGSALALEISNSNSTSPSVVEPTTLSRKTSLRKTLSQKMQRTFYRTSTIEDEEPVNGSASGRRTPTYEEKGKRRADDWQLPETDPSPHAWVESSNGVGTHQKINASVRRRPVVEMFPGPLSMKTAGEKLQVENFRQAGDNELGLTSPKSKSRLKTKESCVMM
ncbi:hypothetical protein RUND412_010541 [Rhizina undulata]